MHQLIYVSRWTDDTRRDVVFALQQIVMASIRNNRMVDITGFLLAQDGLFLQLLEGPALEVRKTFNRIAEDSRHDHVGIISDAPASVRLFKQWNMAAVQGRGKLAIDLRDADAVRSSLVDASRSELERERAAALGR